MFEVGVVQHFDSAHYLRGYQGKCEALHGHRYETIVKIRMPGQDDIGMAYDFTILKKHLKEIVSRLDHTCLNDLPQFAGKNPSAENIAVTIYRELAQKLAGDGVKVYSVEVWETPENRVVYFPD